MRRPSNIVLIGMPGSGKSTVGVILAKLTQRGFIDTDVLIQARTGRSLQEIVDAEGYLALRRIEEEAIFDVSCRDHVIATGGSAVYSARAMNHLKRSGTVVFLQVDLAVLASRIDDFGTRGLAKQPDQTLSDLFVERLPLYQQCADVTIDCSDLSHEEACRVIRDEIDKAGHLA